MTSTTKWLMLGAVVGSLGCNDLSGAKPQTISVLQSRVEADAVWLFQQTSGTLIKDESGIEPTIDIVAEDAGKLEWNGEGLTILEPTVFYPTNAADKVLSGCMATSQLSMEAWVKVSDLAHTGVLFSHGRAGSAIPDEKGEYDFAFMQQQTAWSGPVTSTGAIAASPFVTSGADRIGPEAVHVVTTWSAAQARQYVNGEPVGVQVVGGTFENWGAPEGKEPYQFLFGNSVGKNAGWVGTVYLAALYCRELTTADVAQNYAAGYLPTSTVAAE